ncbi:MAG: flavin reductase family protein [Marinifilaceae bacterium]|jgi:flavin reductase (DIM6/NTAB) family NADH-FMN oxidoreductase RutF|nr:flavin reductase family protein [Marinifilaceae bacterium]
MNVSKVLNIILALALVALGVQLNIKSNNTENKQLEKQSQTIDFSKGELKNIGKKFSFIPTPVVVAGTKVDNKINWITFSNVGYMGMKNIFVGSQKRHYSNIGIKENMTISINMVTESILDKADYVGMVSGKEVDKSKVFDHFSGDLIGAPMIKNAPIAMECKVVKILDVGNYDYFVLEVVNTYANDQIIDSKSKIDFNKFSPIFFEMNSMKYIKTGKPVGAGFQEGRKYKK